MSSGDAIPSNGHRSTSWSFAHLRIDRRSSGHCRVTFDHPPVNAVSATTVAELAEVVGLVEEDADLNVVVFDSADPDVYLGRHEVEPDAAEAADWLDLLARLSRAPVVSIASIRGRVRGAGGEFALACDLRFASREHTVLGQFEVGTGVLSAGGPMVRLSRLVGRGRALEMLLVAGDLDGPTAAQYGYVNRVIADDRLDGEVEAIASGLAGSDHGAIARTKSRVDELLPHRINGGPPHAR